MRRLAFVAGIEFALPPIEKLERAHGFRNFVAEIVGPAAVGVDVIEMLMERLWKEPGDHVEVFVMMRGEPASVLLRSSGRAARLGRVVHDFELTGKEHQPCAASQGS